jgi:hypothetical protein
MSKAFQTQRRPRLWVSSQVSNIRLLTAGPVGAGRGRSMFEGFRYRLGKNMALLSLEGMPGYPPSVLFGCVQFLETHLTTSSVRRL